MDELTILVTNSFAVNVPVTVKLPDTVPVEPVSEYRVKVDPVAIVNE